jgi:class 3 adenylate cyclase
MKNDPAIVDRVLSLLRQYGWEAGLRRLHLEIDAMADPQGKDSLQFFTAWMAAERGAHPEAGQLFEASEQVASLEAWALFGQAFLALRQHDFERGDELLRQSEQRADPEDPALQAAIEHLRGANFFHAGNSELALVHLRRALNSFGTESFGTGRVLDTFGLVYAGRDDFHAAEEFFKQAIVCKADWDDQPGLAVSNGNLGRLYLDWGYLDKAERAFQEDLRIAQNNLDERGEAQIHNHLGQVALDRGEAEAASCRPAEASKHWRDAASWLDSSIRASVGRWPVLEGYARKDRVLLGVSQGDLAAAEANAREAEALFRGAGFDEGLAHVQRVWGMIWWRQRRFDESNRALRAALAHFEKAGEQAEAARTQWEIARSRGAADAPRPLVTQEYLQALRMAEGCRRARLVERIERELKAADPDVYASHLYRRVRGRAVEADTTSLIAGDRKTATALFLDLKGSTDYALGTDPEVVMMTLNQMMANFVTVLRARDAAISGFRGDGFLALFRGQDHAARAVAAALDLFQELAQFNESRAILGLPELVARIGVSTGEMVFGNVGTYDKMDYTAIGTAVNLGARLEAVAEPGYPCISWQTYQAVRDRFTYRDGHPRTIELKGLGMQQMWDVAGQAE